MAAQNELLLKVGLQLDEVIRDFKKLNNVVGGVDDKIKKGSKDWQTSFAKFGLAVNGIEQGFRILDRTVGAAVRGIASFQTEMVRVNTLVNLTTQNFNKLTKQVIGLSKEIPQTVEELSQGLYQVVSAGVDASKAIDFLTVSSKAAVAGFTKTETSVDAITSVINAFGKEADEAESVADVFFTAIRIGKTELDLLAPTLGQFVPQAAAVGVSFEEVAAAMATLTKSAIPTARAATGIGRALTEMVKPASKGEAAIRGLGFASGQAGLDALGFQGTVQALVDDGANLIEIFGDEAARAMLTLGNNAELAASDLDEMTKSAGAMNTAFNLANITLENQRLIMENELQALYLNFSDVLIPGWTRALVNLNAVLKDNGSINAALAKAGDDEVSQLEARKTALDLLQDQFNATGLSRQKQVIFYRENKEALEALGFGVKDFSELNVTMNALMAEAFELTGKITQAKKAEKIVVDNITKAKKEETEIEAGEKRKKALEDFAEFMAKLHRKRLEQIEKEKKELRSLEKSQLSITQNFIRNALREIDEDDAKVDRRYELGRLSTIQYINELKIRRDAEEKGSNAREALENDIEQLQIERFSRLRLGFKEFLKGEIIDWITAQQTKMLASLGVIWAEGGATLGASLTVSLPMYGIGIGILEVAKQAITAFAEGGEARKPTLAMIGEAGPEFVAPEKKFEQYSKDTLTPMIRAQVETKLMTDSGNGVLGATMQEVKDEIKSLRQTVSMPYTILTGTQLKAMNARMTRGYLGT